MEIKIRNLLIIFTIALFAGISGYTGIKNSESLIRKLVNEEFQLLQLADELQIYNLQLRRYEKDIFLNIGKQEVQSQYRKKFIEVIGKIRSNLDKIIPISENIPDIENSAKLAVLSIRENIDTYEEGANELFKSAIANTGGTPQQLNIQMAGYKIATHQIEADLEIFTKAIDELIRKRLVLTIEKTCIYTKIITFSMLFILLVVCFLLFKYYVYSSSNLKLHKKNIELNILSNTDKLTGLYNRHYLDHKLLNYLVDEAKNENELWGVFIADIDHFKGINDRWGHPVGDQVLVQFSSRLKLSLRENDILTRWGGEEFLFLIPDTDYRKVKDLANRIVKVTSENDFNISGDSVSITCSVGFCIFPMIKIKSQSDFSRFIQLADMALYQAKNNGRNQAAGLFINSSAIDTNNISNIHEAIEQGADYYTDSGKNTDPVS